MPRDGEVRRNAAGEVVEVWDASSGQWEPFTQPTASSDIPERNPTASATITTGSGVTGGNAVGASQAAVGTAQAGLQSALEISAAQLEAADFFLDIAEQQWDLYQDVYQPREIAFVAAAFEPVDPSFAANQAGAAVTQAFGKELEIVQRELQRLGIDPSDPRYAATISQVGIAAAEAEAGARNLSREQSRQETFEKQAQVVSLGRGIPTQAASIAAPAVSALGGASSTAARGFSDLSRTQQGLAGTFETIEGRQFQAVEAEKKFARQQQAAKDKAKGGIFGKIAGAVLGPVLGEAGEFIVDLFDDDD